MMIMMMISVDQTFETGAPFLNEVLLKYALYNNHVNTNTNEMIYPVIKKIKKNWIPACTAHHHHHGREVVA